MKTRHFFLVIVSVLLFASCGSKKQVSDAVVGNPVLEKETSLADALQTVISKHAAEPCITSKINLSLSAGRKSVRVGGSLKMKRDDVIQLSLVVALGIIEVGKLELTPDYMMLVDRMNHQYVKCSYQDVDFFRENGIDFQAFQALFWDEWFTLGAKGGKGKFDAEAVGNDIQLVDNQNRNLVLTFLLNAASKMVRETRFSRKGTETPVLTWQYADWTKLGEQDFPGSMKISFALSDENVEAVLKLGSVKADSDWETRTEINKNRYTEVSLQAVFNRIMSLTQ